MKTITLIATALVLSGPIFSVSQAAPASDVPTTIVKFGDLDTSRAAGQEELYHRVTRAAQEVCKPLDPNTSSDQKLTLIPMHKACIAKALSGAVAHINRPEFTDYVATQMPSLAGASIRLASR